MHCGCTRDVFNGSILSLASKFHCLYYFLTASLVLLKPLDLLDKLDIFKRWYERHSSDLILSWLVYVDPILWSGPWPCRIELLRHLLERVTHRHPRLLGEFIR